jgi:AcrR family transcriptional regulator
MNNETQTPCRKERERQFKRQEIVDAAREVFALRGFTAATLDEIADRAEFGKGTLYNYFQSKEELFETVIADAVDEFVDVATRTCTDPERGLSDAYMDFSRQMLQLLFENFSIYGLMMREFHKMEANTHLATLFPNFLIILAEPLKRAIERNEIDAVPAEQVAMMFMFVVFSVFKSAMHMHHGDLMTEPRLHTSLPAEAVQKEIETGVCLIERTFFHGILARQGDDKKHWCFTS